MEPQVIATPIIPQDQLEPTQTQVDAEYIEVELPSNYVFYDFKHLYIKPFKMMHIKKIIQGQANKNVRYLAQVINSVITCEKGYKDLVYRLTQEDFQYLLYWERLHSMPNMPYIYTCECDNPEHVRQVEEGKLSPNSLFFQQTITKSILHTDYLPVDADYSIKEDKYISQALREAIPSIHLHYPLMADYLDMLEAADKELKEDEEGNEVWFITGIPCTYVSIKDAQGKELSFVEKYKLLDEVDPESFYKLKDFESDAVKYGVNEIINTKCPRCGAVSKTEIELTAHSFLPSFDLARSA